MAAIELPPAIRSVILLQQNDDEPAALAGLDRAIRHFLEQERNVLLARPPAGIKDVNDLLNGSYEGAA